ncbi:hypothetical protein J6590_102417 [Homalodisca vitripennis]|nr:hypothetical protein J6590_102417 [Homalodisca vitripennis]
MPAHRPFSSFMLGFIKSGAFQLVQGLQGCSGVQGRTGHLLTKHHSCHSYQGRALFLERIRLSYTRRSSKRHYCSQRVNEEFVEISVYTRLESRRHCYSQRGNGEFVEISLVTRRESRRHCYSHRGNGEFAEISLVTRRESRRDCYSQRVNGEFVEISLVTI